MFIDVHCHLDMLKDIDSVIERARKKGVGIIVANGIDYETNRKVLALSGKFKEVKAALGVYPIDALKMSSSGIDKEIEFIRENAGEIVAIGEVGIDYKESNEKERQEENFIKFIKLAKEIGRPIIVHSRKAEKECVEILERMMARRVIMHCFSGNMGLVEKIIENSWFLSIPTSVAYNGQFQLVVKEVPIENLLCETDSPFMHPERKGENSPENVVSSYAKIAEIKGLSLEEVKRKIEGNYKKLF